MDGVDAALVDVKDHRLLAAIKRPYSDQTHSFLHAVLAEQRCDLAAYSQLNLLLGREFALAVDDLRASTSIDFNDVRAIGSHGQTIAHDASAKFPYTVQLACAHTIAEHSGLTVVADFRSRDMVLGGQGAPFAPLYHHALFAAGQEPVAVVNIGGIANISYFIDDKAYGYDLGPGNCLLDAWIFKHRNQAFDASGAWAASGIVNERLLQRLLQDPYFFLNPPKSIGKEYFSLAWLEKCLGDDVLAEDVQATLLTLTAKSIAEGVFVCPTRPSSLILCGGGVHNKHLKDVLASYLPGMSILSSAELGVDPDYLEAMMFAWLAEKALRGEPLDLRQMTGAKRTAILGVVYAAGSGKRSVHDKK